jgi:hypothetical protein
MLLDIFIPASTINLIGSIIGLAILIFAGIWTLFGFIKLFSWMIGGPYVYKPGKEYNYKPEELWEPPAYWKEALEKAKKDWNVNK